MVNVIGLGYIGLPTALMMASHGVEVVGTDYNEELVATLNAGKTTFKEDGLDELFTDALKAGIKFSTDYQVCDTYIVSVPTPYDKLDKKIDPVLRRSRLQDRPRSRPPRVPCLSSSPPFLPTPSTASCARCLSRPAAVTSGSSMPPSASSRATWSTSCFTTTAPSAPTTPR